jgi:hypothetical protein
MHTITLAFALGVLTAAGGPAPTEPPPELGVRLEIRGTIELPQVAPAGDHQDVARLLRLVQRKGVVSGDDVAAAESLATRYPQEDGVILLREAILLEAAERATSERRFPEAAAYLRRVTALHPDDTAGYLALINLGLKKSDWPEVESAARAALAVEPQNIEAGVALGYGLLRQDRVDEAEDALRAVLERGENATARRLLAKIENTQRQEKGLAQQRLAHFTVRYDGEAHETIGRHVLDVLEEHYVALSLRFGHQPLDPVPVVLLTREKYYDGTAPAWSGGQYDGADGRVRVPIRGLTAARVRDLESTLLHELCHVFVADMTGNRAPRDLQEGLAQFVEGETSAELARKSPAVPGPESNKAFAFYLGALRFVEYLMTQGGQPMLNAALAETGRTGDLEKAFAETYGSSYSALRKAWAQEAGVTDTRVPR